MIDVIYVTGNDHKSRYFSKMVGIDIPHMNIDVDEIQSLDLTEIITHKVKQAYEIVKKPVLVEDTQLTFYALNRLPGPYIKWFLEELGDAGLCKMLNDYENRSAFAGAAIAYYDGHEVTIFESSLQGRISVEPLGETGFGWNRVFIPDGADKTLGQMTDEEFQHYYAQVKPFRAIAEFLKSL